MEIEMYKINEGDDYVSLSEFFYENGLEVKPKIEKPDRVLKYWECKGPGRKSLLRVAHWKHVTVNSLWLILLSTKPIVGKDWACVLCR